MKSIVMCGFCKSGCGNSQNTTAVVTTTIYNFDHGEKFNGESVRNWIG